MRSNVPAILIVLTGSLSLASAGCYGSNAATRDTNRAWQGRSRVSLTAEWGRPHELVARGDTAILRYSFSRSRITLPSAGGYLETGPGHVEGEVVLRPGSIRKVRKDVLVTVGPDDIILGVTGPSLRWGPPSDENMRWGFLFGAHAGMGRLDDTSTALPSGGMYIGGMLGPTVGLVGSFSLAAGSDEAGGAMAFAWGLAAQYWLSTRFWVRGGPAMILAFDPGFENVGLEPGLTTGASFALIRSGAFVLDARVDLSSGTSTTFGTAGIGVNIN